MSAFDPPIHAGMGQKEYEEAMKGSAMKEPLWCVNVIGPDDVYAHRTLLDAVKHAHELNAAFVKRWPLERETDESYVMLYANVCQWPHDAASHADALTRVEPDDAE